jgi:gamma-glutamylcyclotransferase (GGCT)/AIG2-like uncharacterized protein YtfP
LSKHRVFVYGTLKRGIHNHRLLEKSQFIGEAFTVEKFRMYNVGFPIIHESDHPDAKSVFGEVYDVDDETLARLDSLEAEGKMYDRKAVTVYLTSGPPGYTGGVFDGGVHCYIGNPEYWKDSRAVEYVHCNVHDELEWHP